MINAADWSRLPPSPSLPPPPSLRRTSRRTGRGSRLSCLGWGLGTIHQSIWQKNGGAKKVSKPGDRNFFCHTFFCRTLPGSPSGQRGRRGAQPLRAADSTDRSAGGPAERTQAEVHEFTHLDFRASIHGSSCLNPLLHHALPGDNWIASASIGKKRHPFFPQ